MTDLYLIAHKVRGQPAFDIACKIDCPECRGATEIETGQMGAANCIECDSIGFWWIIPTSGHRAYPWWSIELLQCYNLESGEWIPANSCLPPMPPDLQDHYNIDRHLILKEYTKEEVQAGIDLLKLIGLSKPATQPPIVRRI